MHTAAEPKDADTGLLGSSGGTFSWQRGWP